MKSILGQLSSLTVLASLAVPAMAQDRSTFTNPVCSVINFRFCDQGIAPSPVPPPPTFSDTLPPPDEQVVRTPPAKQKQVARAKKAVRGKQPKEASPAEDVDPSQN